MELMALLAHHMEYLPGKLNLITMVDSYSGTVARTLLLPDLTVLEPLTPASATMELAQSISTTGKISAGTLPLIQIPEKLMSGAIAIKPTITMIMP